MAELVVDERRKEGDYLILAKVWRFRPSAKFQEGLKYRLALLYKNKRVFGMDYSPVEGHHKNYPGKKPERYTYLSLEKTLQEFRKEAEIIMRGD